MQWPYQDDWNIYQIPGFQKPAAEKPGQTIHTTLDGEVVFDLGYIALADAVPAYHVMVTQDFGGHKTVFLDDKDQINIFSEPCSDGVNKHVYWYLSPANLKLAPGSYAIQASLNGVLLNFKWLEMAHTKHCNAMTTTLS